MYGIKGQLCNSSVKEMGSYLFMYLSTGVSTCVYWSTGLIEWCFRLECPSLTALPSGTAVFVRLFVYSLLQSI